MRGAFVHTAFMEVETLVDRTLTELDAARLRRLLASHPLPALERMLDEADVVPGPQLDADVITMYTQFELEDGATGTPRIVAICWPEDAEPASGFVSVLSPLGCSALGLRKGAPLAWAAPGGIVRGRIGDILFQPEASGDYLT